MATHYDQYPTPPSTSSPKQYADQYRAYSPQLQPRPAQDTHHQTSYSAPGSPNQAHSRWQAPQTKVDARPQPPQSTLPAGLNNDYYLPPRRSSSPIPSGQQQKPYPHEQYFNPGTASESTIRPPRRRSSPGVSPNTNLPPRRPSPLSQKPLHFSPLNPVPSPFNASRPLPRPGLLRRMLNKIKSWARGFLRWARDNPIKAGLLTFIPVLTGAGMAKMLGGGIATAAKVLGTVGIAIMEGMGGGRTPGHWDGKSKDAKKEAKTEEKEVKEAAQEEWGYGIDDFKGFAGSKGGPVQGFMKIMQMMVNHYGKLTPSAVPRAASLLLELYFLEKINK